MKNQTKPLKRDKSLVPLSKEHHFGLLFCWKLRQGLKNNADPEVMRNYVRYFWQQILKEHCQEEEWVLQRHLPESDTMRLRLVEEHRLLEALILLITDGNDKGRALFKVLDKDLTDHIRWEERELFPYLQTVSDPEELELTGRLLTQKHETCSDEFQPEFWLAAPTTE